MKHALLSFIILMFVSASALQSQNLKTIKLLEPALSADKPFMQAIKERKSSRDFSAKGVSLQDLSNVLWCANGINRPGDGHRTAPSAMNKQDVDVYAVLKDGICCTMPRSMNLSRWRTVIFGRTQACRNGSAQRP